MIFLSWTAMYEGSSDNAYFEVLIPRLLGEIALSDGTRPVTVPETPILSLGRNGRGVQHVAQEICESADLYHLVFVHADTGGRSLEAGLEHRSDAYCQAAHALCGWPCDRCIVITPKHETEAWVLGDRDAVMLALGYAADPNDLGLPASAAAAEGLVDPKAVLSQAVQRVRGRRRRPGASQLFATIAQEQSIEALRGATSFRVFEERVRRALVTLGVLEAI